MTMGFAARRLILPVLVLCLTALPGMAQNGKQSGGDGYAQLARHIERTWQGLGESLTATVPPTRCDRGGQPTTHAIVFGAADAGTHNPGMLGGSENSVALVAETLEGVGLKPANIARLTGPEASRAGLGRALTELRARLNCADHVLLYMTSVMSSSSMMSQLIYGQQGTRDWIAEGADSNPVLRAAAEASPYLVFNVTEDRPNDLLTAETLSDLIADLRNRSAHVTLVLDTAFAGEFRLQERQMLRDPARLWSGGETVPEVLLAPAAGAFSLMYSADNFSFAAQAQLPVGAPNAEIFGVFAYKLSAALYNDTALTAQSLARAIGGMKLGGALAQYENHRIESTDPGLPVLAERLDEVPQTRPAPEAGAVIRITAPSLTRAAEPLERETVEIAGIVEWPAETMIVLVDREQALSRTDGTFRHEIRLENGLNRIEITALTRDNRQHRRVIELNYEGDRQALVGAGRRYALLIANQNYGESSGLPSLSTPLADVEALAEELARYGFRTEAALPDGGTLDLVLRDASRAEIETVLFQISRIAGERDTVLIYYGGHGIYEQMTDTAFWVPADAVAGVPPSYVSASAITEALLRLQAGNVLVISDSCYSGALMRAAPPLASGLETDRMIALQRLADRRSRVLITSGANEPVADGGGDGHSVFARALLTALRETEDEAFSAREMFDRFILPMVAGRADQEPQFRPIARSGHEGGDVVFVRQGG